jgi:hypothetical protein
MAERLPFSRSSTSTGRPVSGSSSTVFADLAPSGSLPGSVEGSRWWSQFSGGDQRPDCFFSFSFRAMCANIKGWFVILYYLEALTVSLFVTALN